MSEHQEQKLGKRPEATRHTGEGPVETEVPADKIKKALKKKDREFTVKESDFDPIDNVIIKDGEESSEHESYNSENFDEEDFMNYVKKNLDRGDARAELDDYKFGQEEEEEEDEDYDEDYKDYDEKGEKEIPGDIFEEAIESDEQVLENDEEEGEEEAFQDRD